MSRARWYVDADTLGLAKILIQVRRDVTFPGDDGARRHPHWNLPRCVVQDPATDDEIWIPQVAREDLVIITRDRHIESRTAEKNAVAASGARMFAITSDEQLDNWGLLEVVVSQWRAMEAAIDEAGPWIHSLTRTAIRRVAL